MSLSFRYMFINIMGKAEYIFNFAFKKKIVR
jgi:hypothetical protein